MVEPFRYHRQRKEFERPPQFEDSELKSLGYHASNHALKKEYMYQNPTHIVLDNIPRYSQHSVNTERVVTASKGMKHEEGGWPKDIDYTEQTETAKWRTRHLKDSLLAAAVKRLAEMTQDAVKQNNQIDMFEEYFLGETVDHSTETLSSRTLMLFKDPNDKKRSISKIAWHPEGPGNRLAVAYSVLRFQRMPEKMPVESYIWDTQTPNHALRTLKPPSPLCSIAFNNKNSEILCGGCYNGLISIWDLREEKPLIWSTQIEKSHHEPVYDIYWLHGKTGSEFASCSTDGRLMWWDFRKQTEPTEQLIVTNGVPDENGNEKVLGSTCLEYNPDAGATKFLAGTESGILVLANKKPQRSVDINGRFGMEGGKHHGPVYACQRNWEEAKCFLTVGDWTAKIWYEDIRTPIMTTRYHDTYLTDGCWSPTRPGVFFVTQMDGWLHVWDFHYRQNEIAFSHKVGDSMLTSISVQNQPNAGKYGSLVAVGDAEGTVTLIELCDSLADLQTNERQAIKNTFEREFNKEKNLMAAKRQNEAKRSARVEEKKVERNEEKHRERLRELEESFFQKVGTQDEFKEPPRDPTPPLKEPTPPPREPTPPPREPTPPPRESTPPPREPTPPQKSPTPPPEDPVEETKQEEEKQEEEKQEEEKQEEEKQEEEKQEEEKQEEAKSEISKSGEQEEVSKEEEETKKETEEVKQEDQKLEEEKAEGEVAQDS